jgi:hypothetical protein
MHKYGFAKFVVAALQDGNCDTTNMIQVWDNLPLHGKTYYREIATLRSDKEMTSRIPYDRYVSIVKYRIEKANELLWEEFRTPNYHEDVLTPEEYAALPFDEYVDRIGYKLTGHMTAFQVFLEEEFHDNRIIPSQRTISEFVQRWAALPELGRSEWPSV